MNIGSISLTRPQPRFGMTRTQEEMQKSMQLRRQVFQTLEQNVMPSMEKLLKRQEKSSDYHSGNVACAAIVDAYIKMSKFMLPQESIIP